MGTNRSGIPVRGVFLGKGSIEIERVAVPAMVFEHDRLHPLAAGVGHVAGSAIEEALHVVEIGQRVPHMHEMIEGETGIFDEIRIHDRRDRLN